MPQRHSRSFPQIALLGAAGCVAIGLAALALRSRSADTSPSGAAAGPSGSSSADPLLTAALSASASPDPSLDPSVPKAQILGKTSVGDAIAVARPFMVNTTGRLDMGSALLSLWAAERLTWDSLEGLPETSPALFRKDPDAERGKRFCITGFIVEIRAEKTLSGRLAQDRPLPLIERPSGTPAPSPVDSSLAGVPSGAAPSTTEWAIPGAGKVYVAVLREKEKAEQVSDTAAVRDARRTKAPLVVEVIAVKSTGALVEGSDARACGVLTGVTMASLSPTSTSDTMEHRIVGMFDLPENHLSAEVAHHGG